MVESRSMVNGPSPGPAPACQARASNSRLTRSSWRTWPHRKLRRKVPSVDGALTTQPSTRPVLPERSAIGVVNAVTAGQGGGHHGHQLVAPVGAPQRFPEVQMPVNQLTQAEIQGEGGRKDQAGIVDQAVVVEGDLDAVGVVAW